MHNQPQNTYTQPHTHTHNKYKLIYAKLLPIDPTQYINSIQQICSKYSVYTYESTRKSVSEGERSVTSNTNESVTNTNSNNNNDGINTINDDNNNHNNMNNDNNSYLIKKQSLKHANHSIRGNNKLLENDKNSSSNRDDTMKIVSDFESRKYIIAGMQFDMGKTSQKPGFFPKPSPRS